MTEFQRNFYQRKLTKPFRIKLFVALSSSWDHFTNAEMAENGPAQKLSSLTLRLMIHPRLRPFPLSLVTSVVWNLGFISRF